MATYDFATGVTFPAGTQTFNSSRQAVGTKLVNTAGADIIISQVGRWVVPGNSLTHVVGIYTGTNFNLGPVASGIVNCAGATSDTFTYATVSGSPYTFRVGSTIYVLSSESDGGDFWWGGFTGYPRLATVGVASADSSSSTAGTITAQGFPGTSWGPTNFRFTSPDVPGWVKTGTNYYTNGYQYAVVNAQDDASSGDTIKLPITGTATWGAGGSSLALNKPITLDGQGATITIANDAPTYGNGAIINYSAARITNIVFQKPAAGSTTAITCTITSGWRVDHCVYNGALGGDPGYFIYADVYGLMDHATINTFIGNDEFLFTRGPSDSWTTPSNLGTNGAVYMEDCVINGGGYTDFNSNARAVVRYCTFSGSNKIDSHGYSTNDSPKMGVRQTEAYRNRFTQGGGNFSSVEIRGGLYIGFENSGANIDGGYTLWDYGYYASNTNWGVYQTPKNYPLAFQIGSGPMRVIGATGLVPYQWAQIISGGTTDFTAIGASSNDVGTQFTASASGTGNGTVYVTNGAGDPSYVWGNIRTGAGWPMNNGTVDTGAIGLYRVQTSSGGATFVGSDIIKANRDVYYDSGAFMANVGVITGSAAGMAGATPTAKFGYWCANTGSWNTTTGANTYGQGQFYTGNGAAWVLAYTPYTYPHPLQGSGTPPDVTLILKRLGRFLKFAGYAPA